MKKQLISQDLPSEIIIYDILTRVPPVSLMRFRYVCKNWSKLFPHNPLFVTLHSQKYNKSTSSGLLFSEHNYFVFIGHNDKKKSYHPFLVNADSCTDILQSFNGLLLLRYRSKDQYQLRSYCVYNPITCCAFNIPIPINDLPSGYETCCEFRLCYDPIVRKYKVVFCGPYKSDSSLLQKIKFLTIREGLGDKCGGDDVSWRDIMVPSTLELPYNSLFHSSSFCLNNSLYWIVGPDCCKPDVVGLDISKGIIYRIKLPKDYSMFKQYVHLTEMDGVLCLSYHTRITALKIWTLKKKNHGYDDDDHDWVERFNIDFKHSMEKLHTFADIADLGIFCSSLLPFAIVTVPKLKIIFARINTEDEYFHESTYYSYDIELKHMEIIHGPSTPIDSPPLHWHVHSIGHW